MSMQYGHCGYVCAYLHINTGRIWMYWAATLFKRQSSGISSYSWHHNNFIWIYVLFFFAALTTHNTRQILEWGIFVVFGTGEEVGLAIPRLYYPAQVLLCLACQLHRRGTNKQEPVLFARKFAQSRMWIAFFSSLRRADSLFFCSANMHELI